MVNGRVLQRQLSLRCQAGFWNNDVGGRQHLQRLLVECHLVGSRINDFCKWGKEGWHL